MLGKAKNEARTAAAPNESMIGDVSSIPNEYAHFAKQSFCKIRTRKQGGTKVATRFLLEINVDPQQLLRGLLTTNHVINEEDFRSGTLQCVLTFEYLTSGKLKLPFQWQPGTHKFFTSKEMDVSFVEFPEEITAELNVEKANWISFHSEDAREGESLFIVQHPAQVSDGSFAIGRGKVERLLVRDPGQTFSQFKYSVSTDPGSSGSPILNSSGQLIGLHRCAFDDGTKGATNARCIQVAMIEYFNKTYIQGAQFLGKFDVMKETYGIIGLTWYKDNIYVLCYNSKKIHVYLDQEPFTELTKKSIQIPQMKDPRDIVANQTDKSIFVSDAGKCLWKIQMSDGKHVIPFRETNGQSQRMSLTPRNELLVVVLRKHRFHLDVYDCSIIRLKKSTPLPEYISRTEKSEDREHINAVCHAVQLLNENFIVSFEVVERLVCFVGEVSGDGKDFIRVFDLRSVESIPMKRWWPVYLTVDTRGNVFIADSQKGGNRIIQLTSELTYFRVIQPINRPERLRCSTKEHQLIVGQGLATVSVSLIQLDG